MGAAAVVSLLTIYSMTKIWSEAFWKPTPEAALAESSVEPASAPPWTMLAPIALLALITVAMGLAAGPVFAFAERAAAQLADPAVYVEAVLGERR